MMDKIGNDECVAIVDGMLQILHSESVWARHHTGEDTNGNPVPVRGQHCVRWSLLGALRRVRLNIEDVHGYLHAGDMTRPVYEAMVRVAQTAYTHRLQRPQGGYVLTSFNEHPLTTFEEVRQFLYTTRQQFAAEQFMQFDHTTEPL